MVTTRIKGSQIFDGTIKSEDIDDTLEKEFTKVRVTTGDAAPDFLHLKIATSGSIIANVIGISGSAQLLALSGTAAGADTQVQFNDGGSFAGSAGLTYSKASSTLFGVTGSFTDNFSIGGSLNVTKDISLTGSNIFLTNPLSIDNNTLYIDPTNNRVGIGKIPSVTFDVSGSLTTTGTDTPSIIFNGDTFVSGAFGISDYLQMKPVGSLRIPTNTTASYIYTSGSTNDLYFTQYSSEFTNTTRLRWLESTLSTGLLHGGILSTQAGTTTFSIASGSGLIVSPNASTTRDPYPTVNYVKWPTYVSQSLTYVATNQITYIGINANGGIIQQTTPFTDGDYLDYISVGRVLHQSGSVTNGAVTKPSTAYSVPQQLSHFTRAFGPLKISGHVLAASGSTLSLTKTAGDSYAEGRNYTVNPDDPNYIRASSDTAVTVSKIYREYVSGSTYVIDTGVANAGYTAVDPTKYNNNGTLAPVAGGQYTIQRVYWFPNSVDRAFYIYYGNVAYNTLDIAEAAIPSETFTEGDNTKTGAIYVAALLVKGNASNLSDTAQARFVQGGLFRSITSTGGGGATAIIPGGLDTYVQFNDGGSTFGGDAEFTYNKTTNILTVGDVSIGGTGTITTTSTTANIFNVTPTTVNIAGNASTLLKMGNSAGQTLISGSVKIPQGLSGSLTQLTDGTSYLIAGSGISISSASNGAIVITNDGTVGDITAVTAGTGLTGGGTSGAVTLAINDSVVATVSGTQFKGAVGVTGSLGASSLSIAGGLLYQLSGVIQQNGNLTWDATNNRLGIGVTNPARQLQVLSGFRFGNNTDYYELLTAGSGIIRWTPGGAVTTLEINNPVLFPPAKTLGFTPSLGSLTIDSGFSRAAAGIINVSGSAPGALFRFNATSTPLAVGDLGMNVSSGRPVMYTTGSVHQAAHIDEVALLTGATFTGAVNFNAGLSGSLTKLTDGTSYLIAGTGVSILTASNGSITVAAAASGIVAGSDTQIQFNDNGSFGADDGFTYNKTTNKLFVSGSLFVGTETATYQEILGVSSIVTASTGTKIGAYFNQTITGHILAGGNESNFYGLGVESINRAKNASGYGNVGFLSYGVHQSTSSHGQLWGYIGGGVIRKPLDGNTSGLVDRSVGLYGTVGYAAATNFTGSITDAVGIFYSNSGISADRTIANSYGIKLTNVGASQGVTNAIGIDIEQINTATGTKLGIRTQDPIVIGTTDVAGSEKLRIFGDTRSEGTLTSAGHILPSADVTYSLGSATQRWQHIYTGDLHLKNERGDWTIIEEETYLTIRNNKTGKRYKINMEPLPELDEELGKFSTGPTKQK